MFEISKSDLRAEISGSIYIQNSLKTKQNKVDYTIIRMSQNVIIRYRYKLFARVETAIDWAQVMTKILVSCVIAPLYENVECRSREKNISLMSLQGAKPINIRKNVVSIIQQKIVIVSLPTEV